MSNWNNSTLRWNALFYNETNFKARYQKISNISVLYLKSQNKRNKSCKYPKCQKTFFGIGNSLNSISSSCCSIRCCVTFSTISSWFLIAFSWAPFWRLTISTAYFCWGKQSSHLSRSWAPIFAAFSSTIKVTIICWTCTYRVMPLHLHASPIFPLFSATLR